MIQDRPQSEAPSPIQNPTPNTEYRTPNTAPSITQSPTPQSPPLLAEAWLVWLTAFANLLLLNRNPLYTLILLLVARLVGQQCGTEGRGVSLPFGRLATVLLTFSTLFNFISLHVGETVLFRLPLNWFWIGGVWTVEAAVFGLANGLLLLTLLALFLTFNAIVPSGDLVRLMPRAFRDLGVVLLIGLTYVPETTKQLQRIREAQAIRGHEMRGLRDWRPVLLPLLVGGLERAMTLAETMVARGYGATQSARQPLLVQLCLLLGLLCAVAGWLVTFALPVMGWGMMGLGGLLILLLLRALGQQTPHTRYRPAVWTWREGAVVGTAVFPLILFLLLPPLRTTLAYTPMPALTLPPFNPLGGLLILLLLTPALLPILPTAK